LLIFAVFWFVDLGYFKLRPHITHYILPMHSHSDVEERDLGPPMTPFYIAATQTLLPH